MKGTKLNCVSSRHHPTMKNDIDRNSCSKARMTAIFCSSPCPAQSSLMALDGNRMTLNNPNILLRAGAMEQVVMGNLICIDATLLRQLDFS